MPEPESTKVAKKWHRAARSRLSMELAGLSFAVAHGFTPRDYAAHLWGQGAEAWMGKRNPNPSEYVQREALAMKTLFPGVDFQASLGDGRAAEIVFTRGCLGTWGEESWLTARKWGLTPEEVCSYCQEAFRLWASALELEAEMTPGREGCFMRVIPRNEG